MIDPTPSINPFGIPKGDTIPYGLNIPVGLLMILFGIFFIYKGLKNNQQDKQRCFCQPIHRAMFSA